MKPKEKNLARQLRSQGLSLNEITKQLGLTKSSVSLWVRDIVLTPAQKKTLSEKGVSKELIEKRRATRLLHENNRRQLIVDTARKEIHKLSDKELWLIGIMLYWAEGGKTQRNMVRFTNSDPEMIKIMMAFLRRICQVPEQKFRCHIHIHPHLNYHQAERYWSSVAKVPLSKFFKTYRIRSKAGKHQRDSLPFGTLDVYVCDTKLFLKICGWVKGVFQSY